LPAPVYVVRLPGAKSRLMMRPGIETERAWNYIESLPFFAVPGDRPYDSLIPVYAIMENDAMILRCERPLDQKAQPLFFALPPATNSTAMPKPADQTQSSSPAVVPLYEYRRARDGRRLYSTRPDLADSEQQRSPEPFCSVWRNPMSLLLLDSE